MVQLSNYAPVTIVAAFGISLTVQLVELVRACSTHWDFLLVQSSTWFVKRFSAPHMVISHHTRHQNNVSIVKEKDKAGK